MKAYDPSPGAGGVNDRRRDDQRAPVRVPRRTQHGPIGFGQVFSMVKKRQGAGSHGAGTPVHERGERHVGQPRDEHHDQQQREHTGLVFDGAAATALPVAVLVDRELSTLASGSVSGIDADASSLAAQNAKAALEAQAPASSRVTPERAMELVADVARDMDNERGARELHLELDPEHLGPIIVKLTVDKGRIRTELRTRDAAAAERLSAGSNDLRDRLAALGFAHVEVDVRQDEGLFS